MCRYLKVCRRKPEQWPCTSREPQGGGTEQIREHTNAHTEARTWIYGHHRKTKSSCQSRALPPPPSPSWSPSTRVTLARLEGKEAVKEVKMALHRRYPGRAPATSPGIASQRGGKVVGWGFAMNDVVPVFSSAGIWLPSQVVRNLCSVERFFGVEVTLRECL